MNIYDWGSILWGGIILVSLFRLGMLLYQDYVSGEPTDSSEETTSSNHLPIAKAGESTEIRAR